jgi:hypothetical protein
MRMILMGVAALALTITPALPQADVQFRKTMEGRKKAAALKKKIEKRAEKRAAEKKKIKP